jgi:hypothetical protein
MKRYVRCYSYWDCRRIRARRCVFAAFSRAKPTRMTSANAGAEPRPRRGEDLPFRPASLSPRVRNRALDELRRCDRRVRRSLRRTVRLDAEPPRGRRPARVTGRSRSHLASRGLAKPSEHAKPQSSRIGRQLPAHRLPSFSARGSSQRRATPREDTPRMRSCTSVYATKRPVRSSGSTHPRLLSVRLRRRVARVGDTAAHPRAPACPYRRSKAGPARLVRSSLARDVAPCGKATR